MDLLKRIKDRSPEYDAQYFQTILDFTIEQGSTMGTSSDFVRWNQGKYFSTRYQMYIYAALLGLKKNYLLPIPYGTPKQKFIEISAWRPVDLADYVIMGVLSKSGIDFNELENTEEDKVERKITELRSLLEGYANGGFDIIRAKREADPAFFEQNENCFLDLLDE